MKWNNNNNVHAQFSTIKEYINKQPSALEQHNIYNGRTTTDRKEQKEKKTSNIEGKRKTRVNNNMRRKDKKKKPTEKNKEIVNRSIHQRLLVQLKLLFLLFEIFHSFRNIFFFFPLRFQWIISCISHIFISALYILPLKHTHMTISYNNKRKRKKNIFCSGFSLFFPFVFVFFFWIAIFFLREKLNVFVLCHFSL